MSQEDNETLCVAYDAVNRDDWEAVAPLLDPELEWVMDERAVNAGTYRGLVAVERWARDLRRAFDEVIAEPEEFIDGGDRIVVFITVRLRPKGSTAEFEIRIAHVWTMRDGKGLRCEVFAEREDALLAVGLRD